MADGQVNRPGHHAVNMQPQMTNSAAKAKLRNRPSASNAVSNSYTVPSDTPETATHKGVLRNPAAHYTRNA